MYWQRENHGGQDCWALYQNWHRSVIHVATLYYRNSDRSFAGWFGIDVDRGFGSTDGTAWPESGEPATWQFGQDLHEAMQQMVLEVKLWEVLRKLDRGASA